MNTNTQTKSPNVVVVDIDSFAEAKISRGDKFVKVQIHSTNAVATYTRAIRQRDGRINARGYAVALARHVNETASLVSTPAFIAWLLDCGFAAI